MRKVETRGRKSLYKKRYCEEIVDHMREGKTALEFASKIGVAQSVIFFWANKHEEFKKAYQLGQTYLQAHTIKIFRGWATGASKQVVDKIYDKHGNILETKTVDVPIFEHANPAGMIFYAKNILKWRDKHEEVEEKGERVNISVYLPDNGRVKKIN